MTTSADVVADGLRRAGVARVFLAEGSDPALVDAIRAAPLPIVAVPGAPSAATMAAITGQLDDPPGVAVVREDEGGVRAAVVDATRARAPAILLASGEPVASASAVKTTVVAGADSAAQWVAHAAQAATKEPPGPVWLVLDADVARRPALPLATSVRPAPVASDVTAIDAVARALAAAVRPLIVAGRECRVPATAGWLRALAEALPAPVLVTPAARGAIPDPHPLCLGPLRADAAILGRADLVLALGVDVDDVTGAGVTFTGPLVRLGRALGWREETTHADGDVGRLLEELAPRLRDRVRADWDVAELDRLRRARPAPAVEPRLAAVVTQLREATPSGTGAVFARTLEPLTPLWLAVSPGELRVHDPVLPAALALALHRPESAVLALTREASLIAAADLAVAVEARARVIVIALDVPGRDPPVAGAGLRVVVAPAGVALARAIGVALDRPGPSVIAVP